jgi:hypothetical protein
MSVEVAGFEMVLEHLELGLCDPPVAGPERLPHRLA